MDGSFLLNFLIKSLSMWGTKKLCKELWADTKIQLRGDKKEAKPSFTIDQKPCDISTVCFCGSIEVIPPKQFVGQQKTTKSNMRITRYARGLFGVNSKDAMKLKIGKGHKSIF